jgi:hypothetical protein
MHRNPTLTFIRHAKQQRGMRRGGTAAFLGTARLWGLPVSWDGVMAVGAGASVVQGNPNGGSGDVREDVELDRNAGDAGEVG